MSSPRKLAPVLPLPRGTDWTAERIVALTSLEVKQLRDNATRLGEPEVAAMCEVALTQQRRDATAARKALPPKPRKAKPPKAAPE
ncbi:MAG: hypothetical protein ACRET8_11520 [Burkholderiales bacterium]